MATAKQLTKSFAFLQAVFPRDLTPAMTEVYLRALDDLTDEQLEFATGRAIRACKFFPTPSELREFSGAKPTVDVDEVLRHIDHLGTYHPNAGHLRPSASTVAQSLGAGIGAAYASVGADGLFSDNETTKDIARRAFSAELAKAPPAETARFLIGASRALPPAVRPALAAGDEPKGPQWGTVNKVAGALRANRPTIVDD